LFFILFGQGDKKMKKEIREELIRYKDALRLACDLRTFPNNRKMGLFYATSLNQLGKLLEKLYAYLDDLIKEKKQKKVLRIIAQTDAKLQKIMYKTKHVNSRL